MQKTGDMWRCSCHRIQHQRLNAFIIIPDKLKSALKHPIKACTGIDNTLMSWQMFRLICQSFPSQLRYQASVSVIPKWSPSRFLLNSFNKLLISYPSQILRGGGRMKANQFGCAVLSLNPTWENICQLLKVCGGFICHLWSLTVGRNAPSLFYKGFKMSSSPPGSRLRAPNP